MQEKSGMYKAFDSG